MQNLYDNMAEYGYDLTKIPFIVQYNKRDLPNASPIADLEAQLNPGWPVEDPELHTPVPDPQVEGRMLREEIEGEWIARAPYLESVALTGDGVFETLRTGAKMVLKTLS